MNSLVSSSGKNPVELLPEDFSDGRARRAELSAVVPISSQLHPEAEHPVHAGVQDTRDPVVGEDGVGQERRLGEAADFQVLEGRHCPSASHRCWTGILGSCV